MDPLCLASLFGNLQLSQVQAPRHFFAYTPKINTPLSDSDVVYKIGQAQSYFKETVAVRVNQLYCYMHEHYAKGSQIETEHKKYYAELKALKKTASDKLKEVRVLYHYIPGMTDPKLLASSASSIMYLELFVERLCQKSSSLRKLFKSAQHTQTLIFYKKTLKACEALTAKETIDEKIAGLYALFSQTREGYADAKSKAKEFPADSLNLYSNIFLYIQYVTLQLDKDADKNDELSRLLTDVTNQLDDCLKTVLTENDANEEQPSTSSDLSVLPTENYFRNGAIGAGWAYPDVWDEVKELQCIAAALHKMQGEIQGRIKELMFDNFHTEISEYKSTLTDLEQSIYRQQRQLAKKAVTNQMHAGWYYVESVLAIGRDVRACLEQFEQVALHGYKFSAQSIKALTHYLNPKETCNDYFTRAPACIALYNAILAACKLMNPNEGTPPLKAGVYEITHQGLAQIALSKTLVLTKEEAEIPAKVAAKAELHHISAFDNRMLQEPVETYLMKGFLRYLYFTDAPKDSKTTQKDPQFQTTLTALSNDPIYSAAFTTSLKLSPPLKELYEAYTF